MVHKTKVESFPYVNSLRSLFPHSLVRPQRVSEVEENKSPAGSTFPFIDFPFFLPFGSCCKPMMLIMKAFSVLHNRFSQFSILCLCSHRWCFKLEAQWLSWQTLNTKLVDAARCSAIGNIVGKEPRTSRTAAVWCFCIIWFRTERQRNVWNNKFFPIGFHGAWKFVRIVHINNTVLFTEGKAIIIETYVSARWLNVFITGWIDCVKPTIIFVVNTK